jgi:hypothetical protein
MKDRMYRLLATTIVLLGFFTSALADHCPDDSIAAGLSETELARIGFERGKFPKVLQRYGPPGSIEEKTDASFPSGSGEARYSWKVGTARLKVFTMFYNDGNRRVESVVAVRVDGNAAVRDLQTKRGLRLGDDFGRVLEIYGRTFMNGRVNGPELPGKTRTICFSDETELGVGVDASGKVIAIWLAPSIE